MMISDDVIIQALQPMQDDCRDLQEYLSEKRTEFQKAYDAEPYGNERDGWSKTVHPTIFDTVEWIKPYLYEIFTGDFFAITGGDKVSAAQLKKYLRFKLFTESDTEDEIDAFLHYALVTHFGIFKVTYVNEWHEEQEEVGSLDQDQFNELQNMGQFDVKTAKYDEIDDYDPISGDNFKRYENVKAVRRVQDYVGPKVECVPPYELYFSQGYTKLKDCPLVAHVVRRTLDYVAKKERDGIYRKGVTEQVKFKLAQRLGEVEVEPEIDAKFEADGVEAPDTVTYNNEMNLLNSEVLIWECYCRMDTDNDGYLEDTIIVICEDVVLCDPIDNEYRTPPFELGSAYNQPHNLIGKPFPEIMAGWQKVMTNMQRSIQDAAIIATKRGWITDSPSTQEALQNWTPGDTALVDKVQNLDQIDFGSPNEFLFKAYEQISADKDKNSGVNEATMGMDRDAMNKTKGGMEMKLNASQSRQRLYARRLSRTFRNVLRRVIDILRLHPPQDDQMVIGTDIQIDQMDLNGNYFVNIDVGIGPQENQMKAQMLDGHLKFLVEVGLEIGVADPTHIIKTMDRKADFLDIDMSDLHYTEEEFGQANERKQQAQALQQQQGMPPGGMPPGGPPPGR